MPDLPPVLLLDLDDTILASGDPTALWTDVVAAYSGELGVSDVSALIDTLESNSGILEGQDKTSTVGYWVGLLSQPDHPEWPGFYAKTELSVWGSQ